MPAKNPLLPRRPVLDWSGFKVVDAPPIGSVERLPHAVFTTSGRAAIYHALLQLGTSDRSTVLVPSYHCPSMVAPVLLARLNVRYFGLRADGLPNLATIDEATARRAKAMIVSHYFGLAQSLAEVRAWCNARNVALIEDCAHCYFGEAGDRPVGAWGDFSTASLSKFFPVPEAGLLASATRPISPIALASPSWNAQFKGWIDVIETAADHNRVAGLNGGLRLLFSLKNALRSRRWRRAGSNAAPAESQEQAMMRDCDMARIDDAPLWASMLIKSVLPRGRIIALRERNFRQYAQHFTGVRGARPLFALPNTVTAPYVYPLWVDDAQRVYRQLTAQQMPVFRWDRIWPGVPRMAGDVGPEWSHHVLQLLCHQDLCPKDVDCIASAVLRLLPTPQPTIDRFPLQHA